MLQSSKEEGWNRFCNVTNTAIMEKIFSLQRMNILFKWLIKKILCTVSTKACSKVQMLNFQRILIRHSTVSENMKLKIGSQFVTVIVKVIFIIIVITFVMNILGHYALWFVSGRMMQEKAV